MSEYTERLKDDLKKEEQEARRAREELFKIHKELESYELLNDLHTEKSIEREDFKEREQIKHKIRQEARDSDYKKRRQDQEQDIERRHQQAMQRQQLRLDQTRQERQEIQKQKNNELSVKSDNDRLNLVDSLQHTAELSDQEHRQLLARQRVQLRHEITLRNGELQAERVFIQDRYKGEQELQEQRGENELKRAEIIAEADHQRELEISQREINLAKVQTYRELSLAKLNNDFALVLEKEKHLNHLDQQDQTIKHQLIKIRAESEALKFKEDQALERRIKEADHNFSQELQRINTEFLKMVLENDLKKELFTHEQETLLRIRKEARDMGLNFEDFSDNEIVQMMNDIDNEPEV